MAPKLGHITNPNTYGVNNQLVPSKPSPTITEPVHIKSRLWACLSSTIWPKASALAGRMWGFVFGQNYLEKWSLFRKGSLKEKKSTLKERHWRAPSYSHLTPISPPSLRWSYPTVAWGFACGSLIFRFTSRTAFFWTKICRRWLQHSSNVSQDGPRWLQDGTKLSDCPKWPQDGGCEMVPNKNCSAQYSRWGRLLRLCHENPQCSSAATWACQILFFDLFLSEQFVNTCSSVWVVALCLACVCLETLWRHGKTTLLGPKSCHSMGGKQCWEPWLVGSPGRVANHHYSNQTNQTCINQLFLVFGFCSNPQKNMIDQFVFVCCSCLEPKRTQTWKTTTCKRKKLTTCPNPAVG